jgi:signal transduction histidine kinase/CheY-like chemotaxis protein
MKPAAITVRTRTGEETGTTADSADARNDSTAKLSRLSLIVTLAGALTIVTAIVDQVFVADFTWLTMVALTLFVAPMKTILIPGVKARVTLGDTITFACATMFGPSAAVIAAATEGTFTSFRMTRNPRKILYNTAMCVLSMAGAGIATKMAFADFGEHTYKLSLPELIVALALFTLTYFLISTFLIGAYLATSSGEPFWEIWKENCTWTSISYGASGVSALGVYLLVGRFGYYSFIIPVGVMGFVYLFYRVYFQKVESANQRADFIEEQLRQSQKMEAVGRLAGGVAHDFNNLLTAILIYSDLLLGTLDDQSPLRNHIEEIKKAGNRAASLTRQLLAFSRKQILQPKVINLNEIISDMKDMLGRLIDEDIEMATVLDPELGDVKADPGQIEQVIMNLVINARDAMPGGGKIVIETLNTSLEYHDTKGKDNHKIMPFVSMIVRDTGHGMDKETISRIFEPFFTTKEEGQGTGLGLSTVYGIINQSGGSIEVESELGKGAIFKIYLPQFTVNKAIKEKSLSFNVSQTNSRTILLVENEEMVRMLILGILKMKGYTVLAAANGKEALALCERYSQPIDLLITDVVMPQMNGREVVEALIQSRPELKVLYISGHTDDAIVRRGVLTEEINLLQKPFQPDDLLRFIRQLLDDQNSTPQK